MRNIRIAFSLVSLLPGAVLVWSQTDPLHLIREALEARYTLTSVTARRTGIGSEGSVLILKKSNLLTATVTSVLTPSNTYKDGRITQGLIGHMVSGGAETRAFVAGERLWVTNIDVKSKGLVFTLLSDSPAGQYFRGALVLPFPKGAIPSPAEAMATVSEVFDTEAPQTTNPSPAVSDQQPPPGRPEAQPQVTSAERQDNAAWDPKFGRMTTADVERINDPTVRFDLNYFRLNPEALDQKPVMRYFIALNNCNNPDIGRASFNELDYPALAAFYKSRAPQILNSLPRTVTDVALYRYIGGDRVNDWVLWSKSLSLGEYDSRRKAFPLKYPGKDAVTISDSLSMDSSARDLRKTCPAAARAAGEVSVHLPAKYVIAMKPAVYRQMPMDEEAARKYIETARPDRSVFLAVDVTILDQPPEISRSDTTISQAAFRVQPARIRVIDSNTVNPLGTLFDDHSLSAEAPPAPAPAPPPAKSADRWAFGDHMYEIRTAVFVFLAADACGWPITAEQSGNLRRFVDQVSTRGNFNERYQYNLTDRRTKDRINVNGRQSFCADTMERRNFDKLAATIAPLGPIATAAPK